MSGDNIVQLTSTNDQTLTTNSTTQPSTTLTITNITSETPTTPTTTITTITSQATNSSSTAESTPSPVRTEAKIVELKIREEYSSEKVYSHVNTRSSIHSQAQPDIRQQYLIPNQYKLRTLKLNEKMYWRLDGWVVVPLYALKYGVRFPLHEFISTFLGFVGIDFAQLVPNSYIHLICFIAFCHECRVQQLINFFFAMFSLGRSKEPEFR